VRGLHYCVATVQRSVLALGAVTLVGGVTTIAFFSGGYFDQPRLIAGIVAGHWSWWRPCSLRDRF
jgi:hypothetical protein